MRNQVLLLFRPCSPRMRRSYHTLMASQVASSHISEFRVKYGRTTQAEWRRTAETLWPGCSNRLYANLRQFVTSGTRERRLGCNLGTTSLEITQIEEIHRRLAKDKLQPNGWSKRNTNNNVSFDGPASEHLFRICWRFPVMSFCIRTKTNLFSVQFVWRTAMGSNRNSNRAEWEMARKSRAWTERKKRRLGK